MKSNQPSSNTPWIGYLFLAYSGLCLVLVFMLSHWSEDQHRALMEDVFPQMEIVIVPTTAPANATQAKKRFYSRLLPSIQRQNAKILGQRQQLLKFAAQTEGGKELSLSQQAKLHSWAELYRSPTGLNDDELIQNLLIRIDVVPTSMALAQSAMESAWGKSRFAKEANNYFGQWCFTAGCGVVPNQRINGATHEVASFPTLDDAVASYMQNINSHPAYKKVRKIRADSRANNKPLDSLEMANGLGKYSEKGQDYIEDLQGMIRFNHLKSFDQQLMEAASQRALASDG